MVADIRITFRVGLTLIMSRRMIRMKSVWRCVEAVGSVWVRGGEEGKE